MNRTAPEFVEPPELLAVLLELGRKMCEWAAMPILLPEVFMLG